MYSAPDSIMVKMESIGYKIYYKIKLCFCHKIFKDKLTITGTNLERITMTVSIFTIMIVITQVIYEVLRVTADEHKCTGKSTFTLQCTW